MLKLPLAKLMMYTDDMNLFLSAREDSIEEVAECLEHTSYVIGCKFNLDKTDVLLVGSAWHKRNAHRTKIQLPSTYVLAPGTALRILGIWIGCRKQAEPRWAQIMAHIRCLISQWATIGASVLN